MGIVNEGVIEVDAGEAKVYVDDIVCLLSDVVNVVHVRQM